MAKNNTEEENVKNNSSADNIENTTDLKEENPEIEQEDVETLEEEQSDNENPLKVIQDELSEMKDKYVRLYSEFDNFRKRASKEKVDLINSASADLIKELLPVLDDFERALKVDNETDRSKGMALIYDKFKKTLLKKGLLEMDIKEGSNFDTELHEAISQIPVEKEKLKGKIIDVVEKGYTLNEKVIRYAKVVVGN